MISPYVRRLRLAGELRALREQADLTHDQLAKKIGGHRPTISRLENGHVPPNMDDVFKILDALGVEGEKWEQAVTIAREAAERGWWESGSKEMGERQALYANLEAGATGIREYQQGLIPGLLQTAEYVRARLTAKGWTKSAAGSTPDGIVEGRMGRQRLLRRPSGPTYELILDEVAIRRATAPQQVLADQYRHLADKASQDKTEIRILPVDATIGSFTVPVCTFSIYSYPSDPSVVAVETVTTDTVLTVPDDVERYVDRYGLLRQAALPPQESIEFLIKAADRLLPGT
ncbi:MAG: helix-turn-helix domain protein [Actinomycetia bacterium]|nr:helix-turn-helix domain protein [Actinomycetes bacterium]